METRKAITFAYVLALIIIAGLALLTHALVTRVIAEQDGAVVDPATRAIEDCCADQRGRNAGIGFVG